MQAIEHRHQQILNCILQFAEDSRDSSSKLKRFLRRFERDDAELEDIMQDALLEAFKCSERYEARSSPQTWLFGLAANVARNHVARRVKSIKVVWQAEPEDKDERTTDGAGPESCDASHCDETYQRIQLSQMSARLEDAIGMLPVDLRHTFDLACLQELPYRDVASTLHIPVGTVRSRVNRARCLLKSAVT